MASLAAQGVPLVLQARGLQAQYQTLTPKPSDERSGLQQADDKNDNRTTGRWGGRWHQERPALDMEKRQLGGLGG